MGLTIRHATEADMAAVLAIYNASIPTRMATSETDPITLEQRLKSFQHHDPQRRPFWVAERSGQVVGYCSLRDFYGRPAYHATVEVALYVDAAHQRQGVGRALLGHAIDACPELGVRTMLSMIFAHNEPSLRLFERFGFERWGLLPRVAELDGRWVDLAVLGKGVGHSAGNSSG